MPPQSLQADGARFGDRAGAGATPVKGIGRRRPQTTPVDALQRLSSRLDELIRDVSHGARSHHQVERLVDEAESIAAGIRGVFRSPTQTQNAPRWQDGGKAMW